MLDSALAAIASAPPSCAGTSTHGAAGSATEIRIGLAFRRIAARLSDESIDALIELARVNGVVPLLQQTASFNWHRKAAIALLGHPSFRKIAFKTVVRDRGLI